MITAAGDAVLKRHAPGSDAALLAGQLAVAGTRPWSSVLLAPLSGTPVPAPSGDLLTLWPRVDVLSPADPELPWAEAGELLARLHGLPVPALQPHGGAARLARALRATGGLPADAAALLRPWRPGCCGGGRHQRRPTDWSTATSTWGSWAGRRPAPWSCSIWTTSASGTPRGTWAGRRASTPPVSSTTRPGTRSGAATSAAADGCPRAGRARPSTTRPGRPS